MAVAEGSDMKLFFETSAQAMIYLLMLPLGILFAACVDLASVIKTARPVFDLMCTMACALCLGICVILFNDNTLRLYHMLSVLSGCLLYLLGIRRVVGWLRHKWDVRCTKKHPVTSRKTKPEVES